MKIPYLLCTFLYSSTSTTSHVALCYPGYTDDVLGYIRESVAKNMLADLKDSVKNNRSLNLQDKYGASAVSATTYPSIVQHTATTYPLACTQQPHTPLLYSTQQPHTPLLYSTQQPHTPLLYSTQQPHTPLVCTAHSNHIPSSVHTALHYIHMYIPVCPPYYGVPLKTSFMSENCTSSTLIIDVDVVVIDVDVVMINVDVTIINVVMVDALQ